MGRDKLKIQTSSNSLICSLMLILFPSVALSVVQIKNNPKLHVLVQTTRIKSGIALAEGNKNWQKICASWQSALAPYYGPNGWGVFAETNCQKINSEPEKKNWSLIISDQLNQLKVELLYTDKSVYKIELPPTNKILDVVSDPEFINLIVSIILDHMPMLFPINSKTLKDFKRMTKGKPANRNSMVVQENKVGDDSSEKKKLESLISLPKKFQIYQLFFDEQTRLWKAEVIANLKDIKKNHVIKNGKKINIDKAHLWAHNAEGLGYLSYQLGPSVESLVEEIKFSESRFGQINYLDHISSYNLLQFRYGFSLLSNPIYKNDISFASLGYEYRSSFSNAWGLETNIWPQVERPVGNVLAEFQGSRSVISYVYRLPVFVETFVDVKPKVGLWDFNAKVPIEVFSDEYVLSDISTGLSMSLGLAVAHKIVWPSFKFSYFLSYDNNVDALTVVEGADIQSFSAGASIFSRFAGVKLDDLGYELNLFAFIFNENVVVAKQDDSLQQEFDIVFDSFQYSLVYSGMGIIWQF